MNRIGQSMCLWGDKRYHTYNWHLRQVFGKKVFKVALDAGFTCPNRDGTVGQDGCVFCSERGSGDFAGSAELSIHAQFAQVREAMSKKWPQAGYIAYFQAYSNTYGKRETLRRIYEQALAEAGVVGLAIATRPDCLPLDVVDYLAELNRRTYLWVELGLQSIHNRTLNRIERGHDYAQFELGLTELRKHNIRVCAHIILGLPGESEEDMMNTARAVATLPLQGIKLHMLHVLRQTKLANQYQEDAFPLLEKMEYVKIVTDILEILPPEMVIQRLTGDGPPDDLIAPLWSRKKWEVLNAIDEELLHRNTWQGKKYK